MSQPAARIVDLHTCPMFTGPVPHVGGPILPPGKITVLIGMLPAATMTSMALCVGPPDMIVGPCAPTVLIGGLPAARMGDMTSHGGVVTMGCFTVLIGMAGAGGSSTGAAAGGGGGGAAVSSCPPSACMSAARRGGAAFVGLG